MVTYAWSIHEGGIVAWCGKECGLTVACGCVVWALQGLTKWQNEVKCIVQHDNIIKLVR